MTIKLDFIDGGVLILILGVLGGMIMKEPWIVSTGGLAFLVALTLQWAQILQKKVDKLEKVLREVGRVNVLRQDPEITLDRRVEFIEEQLWRLPGGPSDTGDLPQPPQPRRGHSGC